MDEFKCEKCKELEKQKSLLIGALDYITEYWNGDTESAVDAIEEAKKAAEEAIAKIEPERYELPENFELEGDDA